MHFPLIGENFRVICWLRFQLFYFLGFRVFGAGSYQKLLVAYSIVCGYLFHRPLGRACYEDVKIPKSTPEICLNCLGLARVTYTY